MTQQSNCMMNLVLSLALTKHFKNCAENSQLVRWQKAEQLNHIVAKCREHAHCDTCDTRFGILDCIIYSILLWQACASSWVSSWSWFSFSFCMSNVTSMPSPACMEKWGETTGWTVERWVALSCTIWTFWEYVGVWHWVWLQHDLQSSQNSQ